MFQLTAFIYVCGDVDGTRVVGDESSEVGVYLEIIRNIAVLLLCLIKLHKETKQSENTLQSIFSCVLIFILLTYCTLVNVTDKVSMLSIQ